MCSSDEVEEKTKELLYQTESNQGSRYSDETKTCTDERSAELQSVKCSDNNLEDSAAAARIESFQQLDCENNKTPALKKAHAENISEDTDETLEEDFPDVNDRRDIDAGSVQITVLTYEAQVVDNSPHEEGINVNETIKTVEGSFSGNDRKQYENLIDMCLECKEREDDQQNKKRVQQDQEKEEIESKAFGQTVGSMNSVNAEQTGNNICQNVHVKAIKSRNLPTSAFKDINMIKNESKMLEQRERNLLSCSLELSSDSEEIIREKWCTRKEDLNGHCVSFSIFLLLILLLLLISPLTLLFLSHSYTTSNLCIGTKGREKSHNYKWLFCLNVQGQHREYFNYVIPSSPRPLYPQGTIISLNLPSPDLPYISVVIRSTLRLGHITGVLETVSSNTESSTISMQETELASHDTNIAVSALHNPTGTALTISSTHENQSQNFTLQNQVLLVTTSDRSPNELEVINPNLLNKTRDKDVQISGIPATNMSGDGKVLCDNVADCYYNGCSRYRCPVYTYKNVLKECLNASCSFKSYISPGLFKSTVQCFLP